MEVKEYTTLKRFLISAFRAFMAGFVTVMVSSLPTMETIDQEAVKSLLTGAVIAGLYTFFKFVQEKNSGRI